MTPRHWVTWLLPFVLILGCASKAANRSKSADAAPEAPAPSGALAPGEPATPMPVEADDARFGASTAEVTVVAFLDYQCRYCRDTFGVLLELRQKYDAETLRIVFKHLPLEGHPMALPAAIAAQAVSDEGGPDAFLEYSELLFTNQASIDYVLLGEWATQVGIARSVYNEAVSSELTLEKVATDARLAWRRGAEGTPTLFVNGRLHAAAPSLEELSQMVDEELAQMRATAGSWASRYALRVTENAESTLATALLAADPGDYRVPVGTSPALGGADAPVTLVVFTDYQCPYCKRADATLHELVTRHPGALRLIFKHLPLSFHQAARPAARLAEAVRKKGGDAAFFAVSADLFAASPELGPDVLAGLGKRHGLDAKTTELAVSGGDPEIERAIERDMELADDVEAAGTPHIFINGKRLAGARPLEHFEAVVRVEKQRAEKRLAAGVAKAAVYADLQAGAVQPGAPQAVDVPPVRAENPTRGPESAPIAIHAFSDFECPFCRKAELTLTELERAYPGKLRIVWHDRPLDFHPLARPAARAGREARRQGGDAAFWKLHALLFGLEGGVAAVSHADVLAHAKTLGLDVAAMEKAMDSELHDAAIDRDIALATELGFQGTPAFVVGEFSLTGARDLRHFKRLVDRSLAQRSTAEPAVESR